MEHMPNWKITGFTVKHVGLAIMDPTLTAQGNWTTLCMVTGHLVMDLHIRFEFWSGDHMQLLTDVRMGIQSCN